MQMFHGKEIIKKIFLIHIFYIENLKNIIQKKLLNIMKNVYAMEMQNMNCRFPKIMLIINKNFIS